MRQGFSSFVGSIALLLALLPLDAEAGRLDDYFQEQSFGRSIAMKYANGIFEVKLWRRPSIDGPIIESSFKHSSLLKALGESFGDDSLSPQALLDLGDDEFKVFEGRLKEVGFLSVIGQSEGPGLSVLGLGSMEAVCCDAAPSRRIVDVLRKSSTFGRALNELTLSAQPPELEMSVAGNQTEQSLKSAPLVGGAQSDVITLEQPSLTIEDYLHDDRFGITQAFNFNGTVKHF